MTDSNLSIRTTQVGNSLYVALTGELDMSTSEDMLPILEQIRKAKVDAMELDLTRIQYIDSDGLARIVQISRAVRNRSIDLTVHVLAGTQIPRVLRLIGAGDLFAVVEEREHRP